MSLPSPILTGFQVAAPRYQASQEQILDWLADAHADAEAAHAQLSSDERDAFAARMRRVIARCACPPSRIGTRGVSFGGPLGEGAEQAAAIYDFAVDPRGADTRARMRCYAEIVDAYFDTAYPAEASERPPRDLVHVTCTGYLSPSSAQKLVARRGWGARTRVTHAYHMGCYAALPALRIAAGLLAAEPNARDARDARVDLVHTELCTLHLDPSRHDLEQLVVQSLFADGLIRYSLTNSTAATHAPGLRLLAAHEQILPDTAELMTWVIAAHGMEMTLSRDVPERIAGALRGFVIDLYRRAGLDVALTRDSRFAVHPGGPKIIDRVREVLELSEAQVATSRAVLFDHGNMSSATLPHIWARLVDDASVPAGTLVASLAFGPGLTVCGAVFEKVAQRGRAR